MLGAHLSPGYGEGGDLLLLLHLGPEAGHQLLAALQLRPQRLHTPTLFTSFTPSSETFPLPSLFMLELEPDLVMAARLLTDPDTDLARLLLLGLRPAVSRVTEDEAVSVLLRRLGSSCRSDFRLCI